MKKHKIYIKDWLSLKPEKYNGHSDIYYLKVANKIRANLDEINLILLSRFLTEDEIDLFCCFISSYFEDVISGTNIWQTFKLQYAELYDKKLPFYELSEDYLDEEINFEDVAFLVWFFINSIIENQFVSPYNDFILDTAHAAMQVLEDEYEYAPENEKLKLIYDFQPKTDEYYERREFLFRVFFDSYLFFPDIKLNMELDILDTIENQKDENPGMLQAYVREITEDYTFNKRSALLSLTASEWAKSLLGKKSEHYGDFDSISTKIIGLFLYKSENSDVVVLEHIASGMQFDVNKKSLDHREGLDEDHIIYIGLVKFRGYWWFSGNFTASNFDANTILDLKNSVEARAQVNPFVDQEEIRSIIKIQEEAFLNFNGNSLVTFLKSQDVGQFLNDYMAFFNDYLNLSEKEREDAQKRTRADGYLRDEESFEIYKDETNEEVTVFFNPAGGIEFYNDVANAFPDDKNPFFTEESHENISHILMSPEVSTEFSQYLVEHYRDKLNYFKSEPYSTYLNDFDFLLRFWKKSDYHTKNKVVLTGDKDDE